MNFSFHQSTSENRKRFIRFFLASINIILALFLLVYFALEQFFSGTIAYLEQWLINFFIFRFFSVFLLMISAIMLLSKRMESFASLTSLLVLGMLSYPLINLLIAGYGEMIVLLSCVLFGLSCLLSLYHIVLIWRSNVKNGVLAFGSILVVTGVFLLLSFLFAPTRVTESSGLSDGIHRRGDKDGTYRELDVKNGKYVSIHAWTSNRKEQLKKRTLFDKSGKITQSWEYAENGQLIRLTYRELNIYEWFENGQLKKKNIHTAGHHERQLWYESGQVKDSFCFSVAGKRRGVYSYYENGQLAVKSLDNHTYNWYADGKPSYKLIEDDHGYTRSMTYDTLGRLKRDYKVQYLNHPDVILDCVGYEKKYYPNSTIKLDVQYVSPGIQQITYYALNGHVKVTGLFESLKATKGHWQIMDTITGEVLKRGVFYKNYEWKTPEVLEEVWPI